MRVHVKHRNNNSFGAAHHCSNEPKGRSQSNVSVRVGLRGHHANNKLTIGVNVGTRDIGSLE
eukprot:1898432-Lingulodinium_polyedra.AAC.1